MVRVVLETREEAARRRVNTPAMALLKVVLVLLVGWCAAAPAPIPARIPDPAPASAPGPDPASDPGPDPASAPGPDPASAPSPEHPDTNASSHADAATLDEEPSVREKRSFHPEPPASGGGGGGSTSSTSTPFTFPSSTPFTFPSSTPFTFPSSTPFTFSSTPKPFTFRPFTFGHSTTPNPFTFVPPTTSSPVSPYFADPQGRPAPSPPTLGQELTPPPSKCPHLETFCDPSSPYRTFSGRCNNLQHPDFGAAGQDFIRFLPPAYDAPALFRTQSVRGGLLPNPRLLSLLLRHVPEGHGQPANALFVQMGQFLDHDFAITTTVSSGGDSGFSCRPCSSWVHPPCAPIPIPVNDPYMPPVTESGQPRCLRFTRSVGHVTRDAHGRRTLRQPNMNTAFIDMAPIYGNEACTAESIRERRGGRLRSDTNHMPLMRPASEFPLCRSEDGHCMHSGDNRANENLGLSMLHVLFHRAHNHIAKGLQGVNPHWDDERLFQEARRINIARFQNLLYREYVPTLIGYHAAAKDQLIPHHEGYFLDYNASVNPAIFNDFTTAAFRVGHSQVPQYFFMMDERYRPYNHVPLHQTFFNPSYLNQPGAFEPLMRGLLATSKRPTDLSFVDCLNNKLFQEGDDPLSGHDLFAINIARGRDHGLASYVRYLSKCKIKEVTSFADLESLMPRRTADLLSKAYADVQDIDLYVGGLSETPMPGAMVGPTFSCILTTQFITSKTGDRFWFEGPGAGFTLDQLQTIRRTSLASVLCGCFYQFDPHVPAQAFLLPDQQSNPLKRCSELPKIDLELWREVPHSPPTPCRHLGHDYQVGRPVPVSPCLVCVCQKDGEVWCRCNLSGCTHEPKDYHCRRVCGHTAPGPQPQPQPHPQYTLH
ncbi:peroxidase-like isoform X2 [Eriocheir sinensis]|uniref:peroxidase-like isoform X2 n=1 Tax=Eriocheir sinensis TaxID=95602 RepID=UPI0021C6E6D5|nr:peroxidase-like isoform X2 [Eriocheir sinensis]